MNELLINIILIFVGAALALSGVLIGGFIMFKGKSTMPNESFIGRAPKGEVFTIDTDDMDEFPGTEEPNQAEEHILRKTETFLKTLTGGE